MTNWAEVRAELDQMLELERSAAHHQRQQQWQRLLHHGKRLHLFLVHFVQWLGLSHTVTTHR